MYFGLIKVNPSNMQKYFILVGEFVTFTFKT